MHGLQNYFYNHLRYMLRHWFPLVLVCLVWAFIVGWVGASFGVPLLFRDDPAYGYKFMQWSLNKPSIAGYTAATVLLAAFLAVVYIFEIAARKNPHGDAGDPSTSNADTSSGLGRLMAAMGAPARFFAVAGAVPLLLLLVAATMPSFELHDDAPACTQQNTFCDAGAATGPAFEEKAPLIHPHEGGKAFIGIVLGGFIALTCGLMIFALSRLVEGIAQAIDRRAPWIEHRLGWVRLLFSAKARRDYPVMVGTGLTVLLLISLFSYLSTTEISLAAMARPGAAICIFFGIIVVFYFVILVLAPSLRFIGVIGFFALYASVGADLYINEFPGFRAADAQRSEGESKVADRIDYYDCLLPLDDRGDPVEAERHRGCSSDDDGKTSQATAGSDPKETPPLLTAKAWADQWRQGKPDDGPRKLVVVATQGGAYRASFWTSLILDELAKKDADGDLPGLTDHIGLLTGASGGMVASAYFTVMGSNDQPLHRQVEAQDCGMNAEGDGPWTFGPVTSKLCLDIHNAADPSNDNSKFTTPRPIARDSLTPVAAQTVLFDMRRVMMWPLTQIPGFDYPHWNDDSHHDRGLILERQWGTLHKSYGELARLQQDRRRKGERHPSMIISPMIADTGQPILISNLDLEGLASNGSNEAVSMFDWFPDVREAFRVQTAVRMNASFPYISPAVSLPTTVRRRVVDAGYYDNYGVNTAVAWLFQDEVLDFLADPDSNIDGLIIIQIRAFPGQDQGQLDADLGAFKKTKGASVQDADNVGRSKERHKPDLPLVPEWLTSPLAGVLAARSGSMAYRNDAQIDRLRRVLEARGKPRTFVDSVIFENHADTDQVGVSWHITPKELAKLESELKRYRNGKAFACLEAFWNDLPEAQDCRVIDIEKDEGPSENRQPAGTALEARYRHD